MLCCFRCFCVQDVPGLGWGGRYTVQDYVAGAIYDGYDIKVSFLKSVVCAQLICEHSVLCDVSFFLWPIRKLK